MNIWHYVAPGFELLGEEILFPSPSASIATFRVSMSPDERRSLAEKLQWSSEFKVLVSHGGLVRVARWGNGTLHWSLREVNGSWESHVYVQEPLATALLEALKLQKEKT